MGSLNQSILSALLRSSSVVVEGIGTFYLKDSTAKIQEDLQSILPPSRLIMLELDYEAKDQGFASFLASMEQRSLKESLDAIRTQSAFWKSNLLKEEPLTLEGLGVFYPQEKQMVFKGERIESGAPNYYGLEQISLSKIKEKRGASPSGSGPYKKSGSKVWPFLLAAALIGVAVLALTNQELIFGKKSDLKEKEAEKKAAVEKKIASPNSAKIDTLNKGSKANQPK